MRIGASPPWLKARLTAAGMRPISNVVDVTNYVMLALENPLHAFDFEALRGGRIVVRRARRARSSRASTATCESSTPPTSSSPTGEAAIAFAGIMGGLETEVTETTTARPARGRQLRAGTILWSSERHALRTEGSNRWEKGVDPYLAPTPPGSRPSSSSSSPEPAGRAIPMSSGTCRAAPVYRTGRANRIVGIEIEEQEQKDILERLGFDVVPGWDVHVPTWRMRDVTREIDLVRRSPASTASRRSRSRCRFGARCSGDSPRISGSGASSRTCSPAPASARPTR